ncbi:polymorphic toxin-type HINT domain-containing protein [Streptomyces sp. NPDC012616]|uniref:polymorphic toxin-type HINT domain-containing protein n=1 Tax=Streptomyces sp. NPDC012616 TaxID=3364840 RepID=UPI0036EC3688
MKSLGKKVARKAAFGLAASAAVLGALSAGHGHAEGQAPATQPVAAVSTTSTAAAQDAHLQTTFHHPFYDETQSAFVDAKDLNAGDVLQTPTGKTEVMSVRLYHANTTTYDLTVGTLHTYYAEAEGELMSGMVTVEVWNPSYRHEKVDLTALSGVYESVPEGASIGLTLDDGEDDCVIVTVESEFSTVAILRDRTFYNLQVSDNFENMEVDVAGEEISWPKGCLLPRSMGVQVLLEAGDRETVWNRYTWVEQ